LELKQEPDLRRVLSQETKLEALCNDTNIFSGNRLDEKQLLETSLKKVKTGAFQAYVLLSKWSDERNRIVSDITSFNTNWPELNLAGNLIRFIS
jgi:hypothetical protein